MKDESAPMMDCDSGVWGERPINWGLRMLRLRGRPLVSGLFDNCAWDIATFLGLDLPEHLELDEVLGAIMPAVAQKGELQSSKAEPRHQLWDNLQHLEKSFGFNATELDLIAFRAMLRLHPGFSELATKYIGTCLDFQFHRRLAAIFEVEPSMVERALDPKGRLAQSGLVSIEVGVLGPLESRLRLPASMISNLVRPNISAGALLASLLPSKREPRLCLDDYPHMWEEVRLLSDALSNALSVKRRGANILLYGAPGNGKTELAAALAADVGCSLYAATNDLAKTMVPKSRLNNATYLQSIIAVAGKGILLMDEAEDIFPTSDSDPEKVSSKATVNECLENNPTPTIWISNRIRHMDEAFLRRFDLVIHVSSLPARAKAELLRKALPLYTLDESEILQYAGQRKLSPAMLRRLAFVATGEGAKDNADVRRDLQILSSHYMKSLGAIPPSFPRQKSTLKHNFDLLNTDIPLKPIIETMARSVGGARMLLHGLPGTGKTEFGKAFAQRMDRPLVRRQASSLLSKWIGETERNLAEMFDEARQEDSVLLLDEADSFLCGRSRAGAHWQITQTNELLTQMENFEGIFICTTNRLDDLDSAALRRFDLKVEFRPLANTQRMELLQQCCESLGIAVDLDEPELGSRVQRLDGLTPGDAAAALRRLTISGETVTVGSLIDALASECRYKGAVRQPIGFLH